MAGRLLDTQRFISDCEPYWYEGTMTLSSKPFWYEDNPNYFSAWYFEILAQAFQSDPVREERYRRHVEACETFHGIPDRDPDIGRYEKISHDELVGYVMGCRTFAPLFIAYGIRNFWCLDNRVVNSITPDSFQWKALYPPAFYYVRAGRKVPGLFQALYVLDCLTTPLKRRGNTSGRMQLLLVSRYMLGSGHRLIRWSTRLFLRSLALQYGTWGGLFGIYFPDHPMAKHVRGWRFL